MFDNSNNRLDKTLKQSMPDIVTYMYMYFTQMIVYKWVFLAKLSNTFDAVACNRVLMAV